MDDFGHLLDRLEGPQSRKTEAGPNKTSAKLAWAIQNLSEATGKSPRVRSKLRIGFLRIQTKGISPLMGESWVFPASRQTAPGIFPLVWGRPCARSSRSVLQLAEWGSRLENLKLSSRKFPVSTSSFRLTGLVRFERFLRSIRAVFLRYWRFQSPGTILYRFRYNSVRSVPQRASRACKTLPSSDRVGRTSGSFRKRPGGRLATSSTRFSGGSSPRTSSR